MSISPGPAILASATENCLIAEPRSRVGLRSNVERCCPLGSAAYTQAMLGFPSRCWDFGDNWHVCLCCDARTVQLKHKGRTDTRRRPDWHRSRSAKCPFSRLYYRPLCVAARFESDLLV